LPQKSIKPGAQFFVLRGQGGKIDINPRILQSRLANDHGSGIHQLADDSAPAVYGLVVHHDFEVLQHF